MANPLPTLIGPWLDTFVAGDWLYFRAYGIASLRFLRQVRLHPELLKAALRFWDPDVHVFRFGDDELCPTVEEFHLYLESFPSSVIVVPPYRQSMAKLLKSCLKISRGSADSLLSGGRLNVLRLMEWYGPEGDTTDAAHQNRRRFAMALCAIAAYLLVSPDGQVSPLLVSVATQMGARKSVVPMVLAETLIGLDLVCTGQSDTFSGSPLLLQLWLSDKLGLLAAPGPNANPLPGQINQRAMIYPKASENAWYRFLNELQPDEIVWRCSWQVLPDMATNSMHFDRMVIAGLTSFTFYIPGRIRRQLGMSQGLHYTGVEAFRVPVLNAQTLLGYEHNWGRRQLGGADPDFSTRLRRRYIA